MMLDPNYIKHHDLPSRTELNHFIKVNGTYMIDDAICNFVEDNRKKDYESGRLSLVRSNIYEDFDNNLFESKRKNSIEHICKSPDTMYILKPDDVIQECQKHDDMCALKHLCCISLFTKRVLPRLPEFIEPNDSDQLPFEINEMRRRLQMSIIQQCNTPWKDKKPCHSCKFNVSDKIRHCNNECLFHHNLRVIDDIQLDFHIDNRSRLRDFKQLLNMSEFDVNKFIPWRNALGDIIFEEEKNETNGNAIDSIVKVGLLKVSNLCDIPNFDVEFLVLAIDNIFFCPLGKKSQGPHICATVGCDQPLASGFTGCSLTGLQLRDRSGSWLVDTSRLDKNGAIISRNRYECNQAFSNKPKHINSGVSKDELRKKETDKFHEAISEIKNPEQLARFAEMMKGSSLTRSIVERSERQKVKERLIDIGSEESTKMAKSGHFSNYEAYVMEAYMQINQLFKFGTRSFKAMLILMEKLLNNSFYMIKKDTSASSSSSSYQKPRVAEIKKDKITLVVNDKELNRKRLLPDSFMISDSTKRHQTNKDSNSCRSLVEVNPETSLSVYNPTVTLSDDNVFNEIKKNIDEEDVNKNLEAKIMELTDKTVKFWALLRQRTHRGKTRPNDLNFSVFIYSFLYLLRDGLIVNVEKANIGLTRIQFFEKDIFLKNALPDNITDLKKFKIVNHGKKDASVVYKNIKETISEFMREGGDYTYIHPDLQDQLDFSLESTHFPPSIWVSIHKKRDINK